MQTRLPTISKHLESNKQQPRGLMVTSPNFQALQGLRDLQPPLLQSSEEFHLLRHLGLSSALDRSKRFANT
jgi:hypothetical protein